MIVSKWIIMDGCMEKIMNKHFRKLIKKSPKLNKNIIDELKRCVFIQYVFDYGDGTYSVNYSRYGERKYYIFSWI